MTNEDRIQRLEDLCIAQQKVIDMLCGAMLKNAVKLKEVGIDASWVNIGGSLWSSRTTSAVGWAQSGTP